MFNYLVCEYQLLEEDMIPADTPIYMQWQTKDVKPNNMDVVRISTDGQLYNGQERVPYTGQVNFYRFRNRGTPGALKWVSYIAEFDQGVMTDIRRIAPEVDEFVSFVLLTRAQNHSK